MQNSLANSGLEAFLDVAHELSHNVVGLRPTCGAPDIVLKQAVPTENVRSVSRDDANNETSRADI
jgi:hypothetical protein